MDGRDARAVRAFFEGHFSPYSIAAAADGRAVGLVTGYYEPLLAGSRTRTAKFAIPLYGPPDDLLTVDLSALHPELKDRRVRARVEGKKVVPYWPRADIERGAAPLSGKALVYVEDPVEAFFLEIQGSGRITLPDGAVIRLNYADQNGHPYRSIGRVLIDRGDLPLRACVDAGDPRLGEGESGQAARAARRESELRVLPRSARAGRGFARRRHRRTSGLARRAAAGGPHHRRGHARHSARARRSSSRRRCRCRPTPLERLVLAQDTGGAIRGAVRADFFWGFGPDAGREAGRMRQDGRMWLLWPRGAPLP